MIYSLTGTISLRRDSYIVLIVGGLGLKVSVPASFVPEIDASGTVSLFTHLHVREDALDLYGFGTEDELSFFEALISVSGVGPKSALGILGVAPLERLHAALAEGDAALFQKTSGIGRKTAERIIIDLKEKIAASYDATTIGKIKADADILEALVGLGYSRKQAQGAIARIDPALLGMNERLRDALKNIKTEQ